jgi:hypothetical protein
MESPRGSSARYGRYDGDLFRLEDGVWPGERWRDGHWQHVTPSEEEFLHVREIGLDEALALIGAPDPDAPPPLVHWPVSDIDFLDARGRYEDGELLDLGEFGTLDPGEVFG